MVVDGYADIDRTSGDFHPGDRVEFHPSTDLWTMGARYGTVHHIDGREVHVSVDKLGGKTVRSSPQLLRKV